MKHELITGTRQILLILTVWYQELGETHRFIIIKVYGETNSNKQQTRKQIWNEISETGQNRKRAKMSCAIFRQ